MEDIGIKAFLDESRSPLSRILKPLAYATFFHFLGRNNRKSYDEQFPTAYKNLEIMVENLAGMLKHRRKMIPISAVIWDWGANYFPTQKQTKEQENILVYTNLDHQIDFRPGEDTMYAYMLAQIAYISNEIVKTSSTREIKTFTACFREVNRLATAVYQQYQTVMPRFTEHDRLTLKVVQWVDEPLNCCPSLHIAYSVLLDNIAEKVIGLEKRNRKAWQSVRTATLRMIPSVLYTKQHAFVCVAFGDLLAKVAFEKSFDLEFNDFIEEFPSMQRADPQIPYPEIATAYRRGEELWQDSGSFVAAVGEYLHEKGYPPVDPHETMAYYDLESGELKKLR